MEYKEFTTGKEIAEYFNSRNIVQIVKLESGFGVFYEISKKDILKKMYMNLPAYSYTEDLKDERFAATSIDLKGLGFSQAEMPIVINEAIETIKHYKDEDGNQFYDKIIVDGLVVKGIASKYFE